MSSSQRRRFRSLCGGGPKRSQIMPAMEETTEQQRVIVAVPADAVAEIEREGLAERLPPSVVQRWTQL